MASWGPKLYQDDVAQSVKDYYTDKLHRGINSIEITEKLIENNVEVIGDDEDGPVFWFALADTQWNLGRLEENVKQKALSYIKDGNDLKRWKIENEEDAKIREKVLLELEQKLIAKQPEEKKISKYKEYNCPWNTGDVFAYKILYGKYKDKYLLFIKIGISLSWPASMSPIVYVYNNIFDCVPIVDELQKIQYLPQFFKPNVYKNRYVNLLYKCHIGIKNYNEKFLKNLQYVGNIDKIEHPINEKHDIYETNNMRYFISKRFEEEQISNYENWENIEYTAQ